MGNSCNRVRKTRRNMPIEKENEVREKARLEMDKVRYGPNISTDTTADPNRFDEIKTLGEVVASNGPNSNSNINKVSNQQSINKTC